MKKYMAEKRCAWLLIAFLLSSLVQVSVQAETRYVATNGLHQHPFTNWNMAATNIASAIIEHGDTIIVGSGVYRPHAATGIGRSVVITSLYGAAHTVLDGGGQSVYGMSVSSASVTSIVYGLTITNFASSGVYMYNGTVTFDNCIITGNSGANGGGFSVNGGDSFLYITNCTIRGNTATPTSGNGGGAIYFYGNAGTTCRVDNSIVSENTTTQIAGGIFIGRGNGYIHNSEIRDNSVTSFGTGGIYGGQEVFNCVISGNSGGGARLFAGSLMKNCLLKNNYGSGWGMGVRTDNSIIWNCTIVSNYSSSYRGGFFGGTAVNSIIYFNYNELGGTSSNYDGVISYSCTAPLPAGVGNIAVNPELVDMPYDCRLVKKSPCRNAGLTQAWMSNDFDLDDNPRVMEDVVDIGAYEYKPPPVGLLFFGQ